MRYEEVQPSAALRSIVDRLWVLEGAAEELPAEPVPPDGYTELIVHSGAPFAEVDAHGHASVQDRVLFAGQMTRAVHLRPRGYASIVGARLRPDAAHQLLGIPQHELADRVTPVRELHRALARRLTDDVVTREDADDRLRALESAIAAVANDRPPQDRGLSHVVTNAIRRRGLVRVTDLARQASLSPRQVERVFQEQVGISPKLFLRVLRFQEVLRATRDVPGRGGWSQLALAHGFYDQAHFIRDFKAFTGVSPAAWQVTDESLAAVFSAIRRDSTQEMGVRAY